MVQKFHKLDYWFWAKHAYKEFHKDLKTIEDKPQVQDQLNEVSQMGRQSIQRELFNLAVDSLSVQAQLAYWGLFYLENILEFLLCLLRLPYCL